MQLELGEGHSGSEQGFWKPGVFDPSPVLSLELRKKVGIQP